MLMDSKHVQARERARQQFATYPERFREHARNQPKERSRKWKADHPERVSATTQAWRNVNTERYHATARARARRWIAANPKRALTNAKNGTARRRARIARVLATLTPQEWEAILDASGRACIYCGSQDQISMDHLTPISKGGNHTAENVAPACLPCNLSKGAKVVAEFLAEKES